MPLNYFITGEPKAGKTTLIREIIMKLKAKGLRVRGFISPEESHHGTRMAFRVVDLESRRQEVLASVDGDGPKVSKYHVDIRAFESIAVPAMDDLDRCDVLVIDEIGIMEMKSSRFANLLDDALNSDTPVIASLHEDYVPKYGAYGEVYELTQSNRQSIAHEILENIDKIGRKKPVAKPKKAPAKKIPKKIPAKKTARKKTVPKKKFESKIAEKKEKRGIFGNVRKLIGI